MAPQARDCPPARQPPGLNGDLIELYLLLGFLPGGWQGGVNRGAFLLLHGPGNQLISGQLYLEAYIAGSQRLDVDPILGRFARAEVL